MYVSTRIYIYIYMFSLLFFLIRYNCSWSRERSLSEDTTFAVSRQRFPFRRFLSFFLIFYLVRSTTTCYHYSSIDYDLLSMGQSWALVAYITTIQCEKKREKKIMDSTRKFVNWLQREIDEDKILVTREKNGNLAETKRTIQTFVPQ